MSVFHAMILGLIQGITEFLPINNTIHLETAQSFFQADYVGKWGLFLFIIQIGTILSVFFYYAGECKHIIVETCLMIRDIMENALRSFCRIAGMKMKRKKIINSAYRKFVIMIVISSIPTAIAGFFLHDLAHISADTMILPGIFMIINGCILVIANNLTIGEKKLKKATYLDAGIIGVIQGLTIMPGISRSGLTITAALLCGFDKRFAVRYSFIMSIPTLIGLLILERKALSFPSAHSISGTVYAAGVLTSLITGIICIRIMTIVVRGKKFLPFAIYSFLFGIGIILWNMIGF